MERKKYPCHHLELKNMSGERWKDIPEFLGYYQVSNMGRIKSLPREREIHYPNRNITIRFTSKDHILKQSIVTSGNKLFPNQPKRLCRVSLNMDGQISVNMVSRLVYRVFKKESITFSEDIILHKNNIGLDNRVNNLIRATYSEQNKLTYARQRRISFFTTMKREQRAKYTARAIRARSKKTAKYNLEGKRIKIYTSIEDAAKDTGISATAISNALNGILLTAGGFIWRSGSLPNRIDVSYYNQSLQHRIMQRRQRVGKYSLSENKLLATYESLLEAAADHGHTNTRQISDVLHGRANTAYGFLWKRIKK